MNTDNLKSFSMLLLIGEDMFEGRSKLHGRPKDGDYFTVGGTTFVCKDKGGKLHDNEPIIGRIDEHRHAPFIEAIHRLMTCKFTKVLPMKKSRVLERYLPEPLPMKGLMEIPMDMAYA